MQYSYSIGETFAVSEMAVVDVFTRLIFNDQGEFTATEKTIIETFRTVDANVLMDSYSEMGEYLRNLGVREMIHLVARIREQLAAQSLGGAQQSATSASLPGDRDKGNCSN
ncbi:hypothetical protein [Gymnodinialimonas sp.]